MPALLSETRKPELPHTVLEAIAHGNVEVPQVLAGITILSGHRMTELLLDGQATWNDCVARPTTEQIAFLGDKVNRAHAAYKIASRYHPEPDKSKRQFGLKRLQYIITASSRNIVRTASGYAALALPPLQPCESLPPYYESTEKEPLLSNHRQLVTELYINEHFRPQAIALTGLWRQATNALRSDEGKRFTESYRRSLFGRPDIRQYALSRLPVLGEIVSGSLARSKAVVEEEAGLELTDDVLNAFIFGMVFEGKPNLAKRQVYTDSENPTEQAATAGLVV